MGYKETDVLGSHKYFVNYFVAEFCLCHKQIICKCHVIVANLQIVIISPQINQNSLMVSDFCNEIKSLIILLDFQYNNYHQLNKVKQNKTDMVRYFVLMKVIITKYHLFELIEDGITLRSIL